MAEDIAGLAARLVRAAREEHGGKVKRIIVEPNGYEEVNVRVGIRDETHPAIYHIRTAAAQKK